MRKERDGGMMREGGRKVGREGGWQCLFPCCD